MAHPDRNEKPFCHVPEDHLFNIGWLWGDLWDEDNEDEGGDGEGDGEADAVVQDNDEVSVRIRGQLERTD